MANSKFLLFATFLPLSAIFLSKGWGKELGIVYEKTGSLDYEGAKRDVSIEESTLSVEGSHFLRRGAGQFSLSGSARWTDVDWTGNPFNVEDGPLYNRATSFGASVLWTRLSTESVGYSVFGSLETARTEGDVYRTASYLQSIRSRLGASINFRYASGIILGVGLIYRNPIVETDLDWLPVLQLYWPINEHWILQTRNGATLTWQRDQDASQKAVFSLLWDSREWHLGKQGGREFSFERDGVSLGFLYSWKWGDVQLEPLITYTFAGESTVWSDLGKVMEDDLNAFLSVEMSVRYTF